MVSTPATSDTDSTGATTATTTTTSTDWLQIQPSSHHSTCLPTHHAHHTHQAHHLYKMLTISKRKSQNSAFWYVQSVMCEKSVKYVQCVMFEMSKTSPQYSRLKRISRCSESSKRNEHSELSTRNKTRDRAKDARPEFSNEEDGPKSKRNFEVICGQNKEGEPRQYYAVRRGSNQRSYHRKEQ